MIVDVLEWVLLLVAYECSKFLFDRVDEEISGYKIERVKNYYYECDECVFRIGSTVPEVALDILDNHKIELH